MNWQDRILDDGTDPERWMAARSGRIGGSDAARFAKLSSAPLYMRDKVLHAFKGNSYTEFGHARESWILKPFGFDQNLALYGSERNDRHSCTPDGIRTVNGRLVLAQAKTTVKPLFHIPPTYMRQMWWEQYVMGADRTLFVWEQHKDFVPTEMEPHSQWVDRDDAKIADLIIIADRVIELLDQANEFAKELEYV